MKCKLFVLISALILTSCAEEVEIASASITPPPEDVALDFRQTFVELLPDAHENLSVNLRKFRACEKEHMAESTNVSLIKNIAEIAREHRIVIINEAHNNSHHRKFIMQLALALKEEGYNLFAAETFATPPGQHEIFQNDMAKRGYALKRDGYYTQDPVYGQLVREVLKIGYQPIFYERENIAPRDTPRGERISMREEEQAENLLARAIEKFPNQKILVHVGFSHGKELPDQRGNIWMGTRLKAKTGVNPLTISQTACEIQGGARESRLKTLTVPSDIHTKEGYDMLVMHPPANYENGRGTWLKEIGRKFVPVPQALQHVSEWRYIAAHRLPYEPIEALSDKKLNSIQPVVYDSLLLGPGQKHDLALEPGHYVIASYDRELLLQSQVKLRVK